MKYGLHPTKEEERKSAAVVPFAWQMQFLDTGQAISLDQSVKHFIPNTSLAWGVMWSIDIDEQPNESC